VRQRVHVYKVAFELCFATTLQLRTARWTPGWIAVLVFMAIVVIDLVNIGAAGPWDPWETHYGEVARQMLVRHDPLDLWWKPGNAGPDGNAENTFWSKPALPFWLMAVSMKVFGVGTSLDPTEMVKSPWPELAIRLPSMLTGWASAAFLGWLVWRLVGARAGILVAVVLSTMPHFAIVRRQALTDMFFVGPIVLAMGAWAFAWIVPDRELRARTVGPIRVPWDRAYLAFLVAFVLVAVVPLAVLHEHVLNPRTWARVAKMAKRVGNPTVADLHTIHLHFLGYWALVGVAIVASSRWQTRRQVCLAVVHLAAGVSLVGKGMIGPGLIGALVLAYVVTIGKMRDLARCSILLGIVLFLLSGLPWHHAMAIYRGESWVNELIVVNNLARFGSGEQKQAVGGFVYYLQTLGLAALPWSGLVPVAILVRPNRDSSQEPSDLARRLEWLALLWTFVTWWVLTYSTTKYYHYVLPLLPPLALWLGLWLDRLAARVGTRRDAYSLVAIALAFTVLALVVKDAIHEPAWLAHLTTYLYTGIWRQGAPGVERLVVCVLPFAGALLVLWFGRIRAALAGMVGSAFLTTAYIIDDYLPATSEAWSQRSMFETYFAQRGERDMLLSWWFYYRGETFFAKADLWVLKEPDREKLQELVDEQRPNGGALWFVTTATHGKRLGSWLPTDLRSRVETRYEGHHYALLRVALSQSDEDSAGTPSFVEEK